MMAPLGSVSTSPKLRILYAHNRYQQRGGEDSVVEDEMALLQHHGHEVACYGRDNHDLGRMSRGAAALQTLWSARTTSEVGALLKSFRPHVLHVHNTFPLISPAIYWAAHWQGVPVVQTLHNFRLICPQALMLRNEQPCEDCVGRLPWPGVVHACYRGSRSQTAVLAAMIAGHRALGTWQRRVTRFIALNTFCRDRFVAGGLPAKRISIKPNFVDLPPSFPRSRAGFLFVGRLSAEKGIGVLAQALHLQPNLPEPMTVVGSGPEAAQLQGLQGVRMVGALNAEQVYERMASARALLLPSIWYESFPRTLVEAFACGLPVIASRLGAMATLVEDGVNGLLFEPGDPSDLRAKMLWCMDNPALLSDMGRAARRTYEATMTPQANLRTLLEIYALSMRERSPCNHAN